jgi:hypothetical protein
VLNAKDLSDLALVILCVVPGDTKLVCNFDIVFSEIVEDCRSMWRVFDDANEVIKVVVKIKPT